MLPKTNKSAIKPTSIHNQTSSTSIQNIDLSSRLGLMKVSVHSLTKEVLEANQALGASSSSPKSNKTS